VAVRMGVHDTVVRVAVRVDQIGPETEHNVTNSGAEGLRYVYVVPSTN